MSQPPEGEHAIFMVIALPMIEDLPFLPYFPAHEAFLVHAGKCQQCHNGAFHRDHFPDDVEYDQLFCPEGWTLRLDVKAKIKSQHIASIWN